MARKKAGPGRQVPRTVSLGGRVEDLSTGNTGVSFAWDTRAFLHVVAAVNDAAFERAKTYARRDWDDNEWTKSNHPYMTGNEASIKENAVIEAEATPDGLHARLVIGSTSDHAAPEEFGTRRQPAHHPIRNVVDRTAPQVSRFIREEARKRGLPTKERRR